MLRQSIIMTMISVWSPPGRVDRSGDESDDGQDRKGKGRKDAKMRGTPLDRTCLTTARIVNLKVPSDCYQGKGPSEQAMSTIYKET